MCKYQWYKKVFEKNRVGVWYREIKQKNMDARTVILLFVKTVLTFFIQQQQHKFKGPEAFSTYGRLYNRKKT